MANRTVRVQPISGKFVLAVSNGRQIRIWLVDPATMRQGTEVSYEDALTLLSMRHPVVCLSQEKGKDGKFIEQFTKEDWDKVHKMHDDAMNQIAGNTLQEPQISKPDENLTKLVEAQAKLIENQNKQLEEMHKNFEKIQKDMEKLMKKNKGDK